MRQLMTQHCHAGGEATQVSVCKSCTYGQSICQIVNAISKNDHPSHAGDVFRCRMHMRVCVAMAMMNHFVLGNYDRVMLWVNIIVGVFII